MNLLRLNYLLSHIWRIDRIQSFFDTSIYTQLPTQFEDVIYEAKEYGK